MPELPEVEVVRRGLDRWVTGRTVAEVEVHHPRAVRRHAAGADDLAARLRGSTIRCASRRGKYLWLPLGGTDATGGAALVGHLGMSGQLLVVEPDEPDGPHLRARIRFVDGGRELRFVDQRTFGGLAVDDLVDAGDGGHVPATVAHIARDLLDPDLDEAALVDRIRRKSVEIKRILLDQTVVSGVGNIYADEALWRARINGRTPGRRLTRPRVREILAAAAAVMTEALAQGGTSFDSLYVDVNGQSGYFERSLDAYGREGEPCHRCGTAIRRMTFMNRSSFFCPVCQPPQRSRSARSAPPEGGRSTRARLTPRG